MNKRISLGLVFGALALWQVTTALAAPACKGPNKNDPGCPGTAEEPAPAASITVDSISVDWLNQKLVVRGSGLDGVGAFSLGGSAALSKTNVTATELELPFDAAMASEADLRGSYLLKADGADLLSVFIRSQIVDPAARGCPCEADWAAELGGRWGASDAACLEIAGPGANDPADFSGTVLSDPLDATVYPQYPIGASFYPGEPDDSVCRLVQVNGDATAFDLVIQRINENQQADCAAVLAAQVCDTITPVP
jgi:hypothetical protein